MPSMFNPKNVSGSKKQKHKFSSTWGKLIPYCKSYIVYIIIAVLCAAAGTVFVILGPDKLKDITNLIAEGLFSNIDIDGIQTIAFTLVAFYASSVILSYVQGFIMATVTQRVSKKLRTDISKKINKLPLKYFDSTSYGDVLSRVTNDVDTISQSLNQSIGTLVTSITQLVGSVVMMFITNWIMALVAIGSSIIGFVFMGLIISKSQKYFRQQQENLGKINGHIEEVYAGHNVIKVYNAEEEFQKDFDVINKKLYKSGWKSQFMSGLMMPLMSFVGNFGYVAVCIAGALLTMNGVISFGVIVSFMVYVRFFTQPLAQLAQVATSLQSTSAASHRVFEFLGEKELDSQSKSTAVLPSAKGNIEFKNVKFGYSSDKIIIKDFSAKINAGQKVAIVGPTGAGKTTMVNLLMKFYELEKSCLNINGVTTNYKVLDKDKPLNISFDENGAVNINQTKTEFNLSKDLTLKIADHGEILVDDTPISELTRENVHNLFCMVLQDTWLFEGTIKENIIYNQKDITDEKIEEVCKAVGLDHFIKTLPKGYDTVLNEEANISAGQKQLITIARAMLSHAPMLILDEATSSVDTRTEILIQNAMDKLMEGRTSIIIAHRLSTIKNADLILVMKEGDIIEKGTHEELLTQKGFYAELYNSQFEEV